MHSKEFKKHRRGNPLFLLITTIVALIVTSTPMTVPALADWHYNQVINSDSYKKTYGSWQVLNLPDEFRLNTIHGAVLPTGKVLLVAGSGNNRDNFNQYHNDDIISVLKTVVYDPATGNVKTVPTPSDFFCGGHALLQSGNELVAGGTSGYELLQNDVKKPGGALEIHDENPHDAPRLLKKGTKFTNANGKTYVSVQDVTIQPAMKMDHGQGNVTIMHSTATVFVEAVAEDSSYVTNTNQHFSIDGLKGDDAKNLYGQGGPMTLNKQDFRGDNKAYEFDPVKEEYVHVGDMNVARWYPTLPVLNDGHVLAVSGLDNTGTITDTTENYNPTTKQWTLGPNRAFPTYPALFRTLDPNVLFFSGSNAGYGPADKGRQPGLWNVQTNSFQPVSGLRDTDRLETSASVALPPTQGSNDGSQDNRVMLAGGGGIGESSAVTARTDIINLADKDMKYTPGPDLPEALRYLNLTVTPWDEVFAAGGSQDYRGKENSYSHKAFSINPTTNQLTPLADEIVSRSYHSGSLLLPDGRILVFGNDPLYSDKANTTPGKFEQRLEIFTPPQLYASSRPTIYGKDGQQVHRGQQLTFTTDSASTIKTARLIPPSSATHVTNIEQRSVGAVVKSVDTNKVTVDLPTDENLLPNGWYMLFVTNDHGTPNRAVMIQVVS
jgi:hypothetical protein